MVAQIQMLKYDTDKPLIKFDFVKKISESMFQNFKLILFLEIWKTH